MIKDITSAAPCVLLLKNVRQVTSVLSDSVCKSSNLRLCTKCKALYTMFQIYMLYRHNPRGTRSMWVEKNVIMVA